MEPRWGESEYDYSPRYEYASPPPPLLHRRGVTQFVFGTVGVAAVATCVILGAAALLGDSSSAPKPHSVSDVVGTDSGIDADMGTGVPAAPLPPATTPAPNKTNRPRGVAKKKTHHVSTNTPATNPPNRPANRVAPASKTPTVPPRPPGVQGAGIVFVSSVAGFENFVGKGTGMLMSSNGDIVTNNHVVRGGTSITVTVPTTGKTYRAAVVGTDPMADVAVIHLVHAARLPVASFGNSSDVANARVNNRVRAVGNAQGRGRLSTARGEVTALNRTVTARDDGGNNPERLTGMIETSVPTVGGDSGGPLYNSTSHIIGMVTAGGALNGSSGAANPTSDAIPITRALKIARKILDGRASARIHLGGPAITGILVVDAAQGGAYVKGVVLGEPADRAGVVPGSVIFGLDGVRITSASSMHEQLSRHRPGERITLIWVDPKGLEHSADLTLGQGPAD